MSEQANWDFIYIYIYIYIYRMEYYLAIEKNEILVHTMLQAGLENIMVSEKSQTT